MPTDVVSVSSRDLPSTVVMSVAGQYTTGDYIGTSAVPQFFTLPPALAGRTQVIETLTVNDKTTTAAVALELWLFNDTFLAPTDNAAWDITDADDLKCINVLPIATTFWFATSSNKTFNQGGLTREIDPVGSLIYYALVSRGTTPTWTSGDLQITLGLR